MLVNGKQGNLISIRDRGLLYGDGVFRTILAINSKARHWPLHYQKLKHDCIALGITCPDAAILSNQLNDLLEEYPDGVVKVIITRGEGERGYAPPISGKSTVIWDISPPPAYPEDRAEKGIKAGYCKLRLSNQPHLAGIKHLNRLENVLAAAELIDTEVDEGLLMDENDNVIEGTRSNLFMLLEGTLVTPDLSQCGVAGVQRDRVIDWATRNDMPLQVRDIGQEELLLADELFVVNSIIGIWPIRELDQRRWMDFPVAKQIRMGLDGEYA